MPYVTSEPYYSLTPRDKVPIPDNADKFPAWMEDNLSRVIGKACGPEALREYAAVYYGQVAAMDALFGKILAKLDELGVADRTLVLFTADHGDMVGAHGCEGKSVHAFYDDLVHVPMIMRLPGVIPAGKRVDELVSSLDVMPTLLDYAGLAIPDAVQGRSLRPLIEGRPGPWAERYVFSETASNPKDVQRMIRDKRWKYVFRSNKRLDLYDLATDPEENINLFDDPATAKPEHIAKARELHAALHRWMVESEDPYAQYVPEQLNLETKTNQSARKRRPAAMAG